MPSIRLFALPVLAASLVAACQTSPAVPETGTVDTHVAMVRWINPAALAIWEVSNSAMSDSGELDPARMDAAAWEKLRGAAQVLEEHSRHMAEARTLWVGAHNDELEGFASRAEIQAMIDADPAGVRGMSRDMADHARELIAAATARDLQQSGGLADSLSERCQVCHSRYWEKSS